MYPRFYPLTVRVDTVHEHVILMCYSLTSSYEGGPRVTGYHCLLRIYPVRTPTVVPRISHRDGFRINWKGSRKNSYHFKILSLYSDRNALDSFK